MESEEERPNCSLLREQKWRLREEMLRRSRLIWLIENWMKRYVQITKNECLSVGAKEENILEVRGRDSGKRIMVECIRSLPMLAMRPCLRWLWRRQWRSSEDWMCWWVKRKWREMKNLQEKEELLGEQCWNLLDGPGWEQTLHRSSHSTLWSDDESESKSVSLLLTSQALKNWSYKDFRISSVVASKNVDQCPFQCDSLHSSLSSSSREDKGSSS